MQRLAITISTLLIIVMILLNLVLLRQNSQLRGRIALPEPTQALADQAAKIAQLEQELQRSEDDRIKATRAATAARDQLGQLQGAAAERDALKAQLQALRQQNDQLRSEVGNLQTMNAIGGQVAPLRGLAPLRAVPRTFMSHDQLRAHFTELLAQLWPPEEEARQAAILRALDLPGAGDGLRQREIDGMVNSVLGFYEQDTKRLVVVTDRAQMGVRDRVTYAHEFTHSLQDQHYDLTALFAAVAGNADAQLALKALVEGDATLTMGLYARDNLSALDQANLQLEEYQSIDLSGLVFGGGGPLVESAAYFPYREGATFAARLYQQGGWAAVNAAFANPPRSSEQVLHPERYFAGEPPVPVRLPASAPPGWRVLADDTLGELYLRIYLERALPLELAAAACDGWGGDRYRVLSDEQGRLALILQTVWDDERSARRFAGALGALVASLGGGNAAVVASGAAGTRWQLPGRQFYVGAAGERVLVLHAPDAAALDALVGQLGG